MVLFFKIHVTNSIHNLNDRHLFTTCIRTLCCNNFLSKIVIIVLFGVLSVSDVLGQVGSVHLFTASDADQELSQKTQSKLQDIRKTNYVKEVRVIKIPTYLYREDEIFIPISDSNRVSMLSGKSMDRFIPVKKDTVFVSSDEYLAWQGRIDYPGMWGEVSLVQNVLGTTSGSFEVNGKSYYISPLEDDLHALVRYEIPPEDIQKQAEMKRDLHDLNSGNEQNSPELDFNTGANNENGPEIQSSCISELDVAIFYTPSAA